MRTIFLTSLLFQIFKEENQQFLFSGLDGKKAPKAAKFLLLHFFISTLDLLRKWGTYIFFPSMFFFLLEAETIELVLPSAASS